MTNLIYDAVDWYRDLLDNKSDPRVNDWPMMDSPFPTLFICLFFAYFSKSLGPRIMKNRKPLNLRKLLVFYNLFQTLFSLWIFYNFLRSGWWGNYSFKCQPVDYSRSPIALRMASTCWYYYISKFTEFFDTLFFILRKKMEHVSTLHVIHHGCMPFSVWMGLKFTPGGHSSFFALLNSFVHIVMYFYYMIAAMGPKYQKYIWWKKYLTSFQMVQFVIILIHQFQLLFRDCDYQKGFMIWIGLHGLMFLFLFSDFYKAKYIKRAARNKKVDDDYNENLLQKKPQTNGVACMSVMNGDDEDIMHKSSAALQTKHLNGYSNGISNGNGYLKTNGVTNGTISSSSTTATTVETNGGIRSRKQQ